MDHRGSLGEFNAKIAWRTVNGLRKTSERRQIGVADIVDQLTNLPGTQKQVQNQSTDWQKNQQLTFYRRNESVFGPHFQFEQ